MLGGSGGERNELGRGICAEMERDAVEPKLDAPAHVHKADLASVESDLLSGLAHTVDALLVDEDLLRAAVAEKLVIVVVDPDEADFLGLDAVGTSVDDEKAV